jgi:hypothetical protein
VIPIVLTKYRLLLSTGQVDAFGMPTENAVAHWTPQERADLADAMIREWTAFRLAGQQSVDHSAALAANLAR